MSFLIIWRSSAIGSYCLYNDWSLAPIGCWQQESSGIVEEDRVINESFSYWLTDLDPEVRLAEAVVEVMTTDSDDRRRNRRRRHAWSIL